MKKAILDDIVPAAEDLRKCKDVVAKGLGTKLSDKEMQPLVEVTDGLHRTYTIP